MSARCAAVTAILLWGTAGHAAAPVVSQLTAAKAVRGAFLGRGMGARPAALGEAYAALADDAAALSWNPGGLGRIGGPDLVAMFEHLGGGMGVSYLAGALPTVAGVVGASLSALDYGGFEAFDAMGTRTGFERPADFGAALGWAVANPEGLMPSGWSGVAVEAAMEAVGGVLWGVNAGWVFRVTPRIAMGMALLHAGPRRGAASLPAVARAGAAWLAGAHVAATVEASYGITARLPALAAGIEYSPVRGTALRAGYRRQGGDAAPSSGGISAGLGLSAGGVGLDYAYQPVGGGITSHRVALTLGAARAF